MEGILVDYTAFGLAGRGCGDRFVVCSFAWRIWSYFNAGRQYTGQNSHDTCSDLFFDSGRRYESGFNTCGDRVGYCPCFYRYNRLLEEKSHKYYMSLR